MDTDKIVFSVDTFFFSLELHSLTAQTSPNPDSLWKNQCSYMTLRAKLGKVDQFKDECLTQHGPMSCSVLGGNTPIL